VHAVTKGECPKDFKSGESWLIENSRTPGGMCTGAYESTAPAIRTFRYGGARPWDKDKGVTYVSCPDPEHFVIYEVRRL
jgi:uncharacterized repeat protein (TIGR04076 family)